MQKKWYYWTTKPAQAAQLLEKNELLVLVTRKKLAMGAAHFFQ
jgi:hypothetical protein